MLFLVLRGAPSIVLAVFVEEVVCVMRLVAKDGSLCVCLVLCLHERRAALRREHLVGVLTSATGVSADAMSRMLSKALERGSPSTATCDSNVCALCLVPAPFFLSDIRYV